LFCQPGKEGAHEKGCVGSPAGAGCRCAANDCAGRRGYWPIASAVNGSIVLVVPPISRRALGRSRCSRVKRSDLSRPERVDTDESEPTTSRAGSCAAARPDQLQCFGGGAGVGCGLVRLDDTDAVGGVGEHQPLGLEGAEQVPQSAGVIGLMFATVEPSGHVVAGDLPQSAVVDGDLGQERSDAGQPGEGGAPRTSPPPRGAPSRSTSIQTCGLGRPATPARAPVEATKAVGGERRSHAAVVRSGAGC